MMEPLLTIQAAMDRWIQRFAPDWVPEQTGMKRKMEPWRSLQEGGIPCLKGEAARQAFNRVEKKDAVYFRPGADPHDLAAEVFPCTDASVFECMGDIYITDRSFSWTYVHTRYPWFGPYFVRFQKW
ncbi:MAG: DUF4275 family protein [Lachnospiraceae bacterium]|nr:DUF4275 family protein [Lachnospiraceae bacterium]